MFSTANKISATFDINSQFFTVRISYLFLIIYLISYYVSIFVSFICCLIAFLSFAFYLSIFRDINQQDNRKGV